MVNTSSLHDGIRGQAEEIAKRLEGELAGLTLAERACVLILSNQMLDLAARTWGRDIRESPVSAPPRMLLACLAALNEAMKATRDMIEWQGPTAAGERQLLSTELTFLTVAHMASPKTAAAATACWRLLWSDRSHVGDALILLRDWEAETGVDAVPRNARGKRQTDEEIVESAMRYPEFFRKAAKRIRVAHEDEQ